MSNLVLDRERDVRWEGGGSKDKYEVQKGKGISESRQGEGGVQTPENNTDVICTLPPRVWSQSKTHLVGNRYCSPQCGGIIHAWVNHWVTCRQDQRPRKSLDPQISCEFPFQVSRTRISKLPTHTDKLFLDIEEVRLVGASAPTLQHGIPYPMVWIHTVTFTNNCVPTVVVPI